MAISSLTITTVFQTKTTCTSCRTVTAIQIETKPQALQNGDRSSNRNSRLPET